MKKDLKDLKKEELVALAKKQKIAKPALLKKDALIKLLAKKKTVAKKSPKKSSPRKTVATRKVKATKPSKRRLDDLTLLHQETQHIHSHISQPPQEQQTFRAGTGELPGSYGETKLVVMVRDPYWAYSYWDLSEETHNYVASVYREKEGVRPILRIYDVTGISFNGGNGHSSWDLDVSLDARNWYLNLGVPGSSFIIDLGLKDKNGEFFLLARSNKISLPIDYPSSVVDEEWMISDLDFDELYAISGGVGISSGQIKKKKKILFQEILSSGSVASSGAVQKAKERGFFLEVDTELILYGRTYSNASVTVDNKNVKLRPDGTFSLRYHLPNGALKLPVKAISSDGVDSRKTTIKVNKETK
ncbi:DUF4912 domain-containing protein [Candidatus Omnitrophota bacterium]